MARQRIETFREFRALVREDYETHNRSFCPGFRAVAVHRFGAWANARSHRILRGPLCRLYRLLQARAKNVLGVEIDPRAEIGRRLFIAHQGAIVIGSHVRIGDDVKLHQGVTIGKTGNPELDVKRPVICNGAKIGVGAVVIGGVVVGENSLIGPNVVVREDVPPNSTVQPPEPVIRPKGRRRNGAMRARRRHGQPGSDGVVPTGSRRDQRPPRDLH